MQLQTEQHGRLVGLSVGHSRKPCKKAESIEMLFGLWSRVGSRNNALDRVQIPYSKGQL